MGKKLIDGLWYNEDTADIIAEHPSNNGGSVCSDDFNYFHESIRVTRKGNLFLYGTGGALTSYASDCGNNSTTGSDGIIPMSREEVMEWCEDKHAYIEDHKKFEKYVGKIKDA
tara:strand:- start:104 stop:442 length:339 start_codon:yes stop_codon:yes gene_type:complete